MIRANLLHLSSNMWIDTEAPPECQEQYRYKYFDPALRCEDGVWAECIRHMAETGMNMLVVDVGDGVQYQSHPELSVEGAWTREKLKDELARCRDQGIEPIPKLNFSSAHDAWLGEYSRMLSTPQYYTVCGDLIKEVHDLFDGPRFFHLGMDEETFGHQKHYQYAVVRQGDLWWHDLNVLVEQAEAAGGRAWVWSDVLWNCERETFASNMPRSVIQSNWYYSGEFPEDDAPDSLKTFTWLEEMGYQQIPTGSTWSCEENYSRLVAYCTKCISEQNLLGFMMADWRFTTAACRQQHLDAIDLVASAHGADRG